MDTMVATESSDRPDALEALGDAVVDVGVGVVVVVVVGVVVVGVGAVVDGGAVACTKVGKVKPVGAATHSAAVPVHTVHI